MEAWERLQPVVEALVSRVTEQGLTVLSPTERNTYLTWCYPSAVDNGGHASFFYNPYGQFANETLHALRDIGALQYAEILQRAIRQFPKAYVPVDIVERNTTFNSLPAKAHREMESCDKAFFRLGSDRLLSRLLEYWTSRAA